MGNSTSTDKGRRALSQVLLKPGAEASTKQLKTIFSLYDTNHDGLLGWAEAKRYLSDLLELSGTQANVIREARETGQSNIAQWYEQYLRELFDHLDDNHDGYLDISELVKPGRDTVAQLLASVSAKVGQAPAPGTQLVLSAKLRQENISKVLDSPTSAPCLNGCGFYGSGDHYGYCDSCAGLIAGALGQTVAVLDPEEINSNNSNNTPVAPVVPPTDAVVVPPAATPAVALVQKDPVKAVVAEAPADKPAKKTRKKRVAKKKPAVEEQEPEDDGSGSGEEEHELSSGEEDLLNSAEGNGFLEVSTNDRHAKFSVLDGEQVEKLMARKIKDAAELLGVTDDEAALVLMYFDWNTSRLQEQYFLDVDKYRMRAGIDVGDKPPQKAVGGDCSICFDAVNQSETASLNCSHGPFCKACYADYLHEKVLNYGAQGILLSNCMGRQCPLRLSPLHWKRMAAPADYLRYRYFYLKQFVESTNNLGFCPNPSCTKVVKFSGLGRPADVVECMCGQKYCFSCCQEAHNPVSCEQFRLWCEKNASDTESLKFILATTKQCPHCKMATERNEGCNHMTCRKEVGGCGGQWCWMCRGDWATHGEKTGGYFSCNLYDKSAAKKIDENAGSVVLEAQYFEHFSERFMNHGQMEKDAEKKREECITVWMCQYREETGGSDPQFLLDALELLIRCRHTLKFTYVYAWFQDQAIKNKLADKTPDNSNNDANDDLQTRLARLKTKNKARKGKATNAAGAAAMARAQASTGPAAALQAQKELFDFQQASLEGVTESLGELVFSGTAGQRAAELKNLTRITRQYLNNLVTGFEDMRSDDEEEQ